MPLPSIIDIARTDLYTSREELEAKHYALAQIEHILRLRDMVTWCIANPDSKDRQFVDEILQRYDVSKVTAYADLKIVKSLLPNLAEATRDYHRWRYNEMILETYQMAKKRKDTKTMEKAASSYAKYNRVDLEDEQAVPYDLIVVQPFTATDDPTVLGIKPIPRLQERIQELLHKYQAENIDIEDIEYEEADLEEQSLFPNEENNDGTEPEEDIL